MVTGLKCVVCGRVHSTQVPYTCPECGGILDVQYDYPAIRKSLTRAALRRRPLDQWRYRELLPIGARAAVPSLSTGWTPITSAPALARHLGSRTLYLKDDGRNPTGSFKDRSSAVGVAAALEKRAKIIACASTGNAASSLAGMAAAAGLRSVIFIPERTPEAKVAQLVVFGATVFRVRGSYDQAYELCQQACTRWDWYNRNAAINPYLVEGKKTCGLEICEQMDWRPPDWVVLSVGDGCSIAGTWKAFREMKTLGLIERLPRMLGVLPEAGAATIADSIAVAAPRNSLKAQNAVQESRGAMVRVPDAEILEAVSYTGRLAGIFAEPAAAAAVAGLRRALRGGLVSRRASALVVITGNGLKDIRALGPPASRRLFDIAPNIGQVEEHL